MNHRLPYLNLCGVLALAVLCVLQWRQDRQLNLTLNQSEQTRLDQETKLDDQTKKAAGLDADLTQFKTSLLDEQKQHSAMALKLRAADSTNEVLSLECEQLRSAVTNWAGAVTLRDGRIQEANRRIGKLADDLNVSIGKYNSLVTNYNAVVKDFDALRASAATNATGNAVSQ